MVNTSDSMKPKFTNEEVMAMLETIRYSVPSRALPYSPSEIWIMNQEKTEKRNMRLYGNLFGPNGRSEKEDNIEEGYYLL
jgi:hypothetical protein